MKVKKTNAANSCVICAQTKRGFSVLEVILAVALFSIFSTAAISFIFESMQMQSQAQQFETASVYAEDGLEKVRSIRDSSFDNLVDDADNGLQFIDGKWELNGDYDELDIYKRVISIEQVRRDAGGDIVSENGIEDADMKKITADVSWSTPSGQTVSTQLVTYLSRWK